MRAVPSQYHRPPYSRGRGLDRISVWNSKYSSGSGMAPISLEALSRQRRSRAPSPRIAPHRHPQRQKQPKTWGANDGGLPCASLVSRCFTGPGSGWQMMTVERWTQAVCEPAPSRTVSSSQCRSSHLVQVGSSPVSESPATVLSESCQDPASMYGNPPSPAPNMRFSQHPAGRLGMIS